MSASPAPTRRMSPAERDATLRTVVHAFAADPLLRWWFPGEEYDARAAAFFGFLLDLRVDGGEVWLAGDGGAVSMWNPPGGLLVEPGSAQERWETVRDGLPDDVAGRLDAVEHQVHAALPRHPHWYLGVLATHPDRRRQGLASAVLAPVLAHADRAGLEVWLETASAPNLGFYARHGFAVTQTLQVDDAPQVHVLRRTPAARAG